MRVITKENEIISEKFKNYLLDRGIAYAKLGRKIGLSKQYMSQMMNNSCPITEINRKKMNEFLGTDF